MPGEMWAEMGGFQKRSSIAGKEIFRFFIRFTSSKAASTTLFSWLRSLALAGVTKHHHNLLDLTSAVLIVDASALQV